MSNPPYPMTGLVSNMNVDTETKSTSNNEPLSEVSPVELSGSPIGAEATEQGTSPGQYVHEPARISSQHQDPAKDGDDDQLPSLVPGLVSPDDSLERARSRPVSPALVAGPHQHVPDADSGAAGRIEGEHGVPVPEVNALSGSAMPKRMVRKNIESSGEGTPSDEDDYDMDDRHYLHKSSEVQKIDASPVQTTVSNVKHYDDAGQLDQEVDPHKGVWTETATSAQEVTHRVPGMWSDTFDEQDADGGSERKDQGLIDAMLRLVLG